jgi:hypothetical protein
MPRRVLRFLGTFALVLSPTIALAWNQKALLGTRVHEHAMHSVELEAQGCALTYKLSFSAPADGYASRATNRNYYVFRTRIKFHGGKKVTVPVFGNAGPGERVYARTYDTSGEGCWAKEPKRLMGLDVEACRNRGCTPDPLP